MFFGVQLKSSSPKPHSLDLQNTLKLSQAVLIPYKNGKQEPTQVIAEYDGKQFVLCVLGQTVAWQSPLDIFFAAGSKVKLSTKGPGTVHLTGYEVLEDEDEDIVFSDISEDESDTETREVTAEESTEESVPSGASSAEEEEDDDDDDDDEDEDLEVDDTPNKNRKVMIKTSGRKTIPNGILKKQAKAKKPEPEVPDVEDEESEDESYEVEDEDMSADDLSDEDMSDDQDEEIVTAAY